MNQSATPALAIHWRVLFAGCQIGCIVKQVDVDHVDDGSIHIPSGSQESFSWPFALQKLRMGKLRSFKLIFCGGGGNFPTGPSIHARLGDIGHVRNGRKVLLDIIVFPTGQNIPVNRLIYVPILTYPMVCRTNRYANKSIDGLGYSDRFRFSMEALGTVHHHCVTDVD